VRQITSIVFFVLALFLLLCQSSLLQRALGVTSLDLRLASMAASTLSFNQLSSLLKSRTGSNFRFTYRINAAGTFPPSPPLRSWSVANAKWQLYYIVLIILKV
jgi:hypothetical protein